MGMKKGDTQGYTFMPFLFLQINAFIWTVYAFHFGIGSMLQPAIGNAWGLLVNTAYLVVYGANMKDPDVRKKFFKIVTLLETVFILIAVVSWGAKLLRPKFDVLLDGQAGRSCQLFPIYWGLRCVRENVGDQIRGVLSHIDTMPWLHRVLRLHLLLYPPERHERIDSECDR